MANNWMELYRWDPFVDWSIDRRLVLRNTPIFLILLVGQDQTKTKQNKSSLNNCVGFRDSVLSLFFWVDLC